MCRAGRAAACGMLPAQRHPVQGLPCGQSCGQSSFWAPQVMSAHYNSTAQRAAVLSLTALAKHLRKCLAHAAHHHGPAGIEAHCQLNRQVSTAGLAQEARRLCALVSHATAPCHGSRITAAAEQRQQKQQKQAWRLRRQRSSSTTTTTTKSSGRSRLREAGSGSQATLYPSTPTGCQKQSWRRPAWRPGSPTPPGCQRACRPAGGPPTSPWRVPWPCGQLRACCEVGS